jgi:hypothetical protein
MCGPTATANSSITPNMGITGLGDKERRVSTSSSSSSETPVVQHYNGGLHHVHFATAYSTLLCNLAEAYELTNANTSFASDYLSSALKALNPHEGDIRSHPYFARPLRMIGTSHMKVSHAVTAEGLYRSGLEKLATSHDYR